MVCRSLPGWPPCDRPADVAWWSPTEGEFGLCQPHSDFLDKHNRETRAKEQAA